MFQRLFNRDRGKNQEITGAIYAAIVAAARQPHFYSDWDVPDTPLGRFEMMSIHMILVLRRLTKGGSAEKEIAQELTDKFFTEVDHSLRELGIGDVAVPKRIKKLAKMFYGRAASYGVALEAGDKAELATALARNVVPGQGDWPFGPQLAHYLEEAGRLLAAQSDSQLLAGNLEFPVAGAAGE
ncbi:MAG: ubiquinol-cytochrome C chaperone [Rhizobiaceae bacterium]|nr:ubiquinol-cytochrome C chaperone [Rhizobiaceae bacterium]